MGTTALPHGRYDGIVVNDELLPLKWAAINAGVFGDNTLVAAVSGKRIRVYAVSFNAALAVAVSFKSGPNTKIEAMTIAANGNFSANHFPGWFVETNPGEALVMNNSLAVNVRGGLSYAEVP